MPTEYKSIEYRLHESLVQIQEMLVLLEFDQELLNEILECKDLIKTKKYNIAVMGEFKRGKSSLINALLGSKILPADATPTTATVNRITYGTEPATIIIYQDGSKKEIRIDDLKDYVTKITPEGQTRAMQIKEAIVYFPTVIGQNHIDIIDTPGLNDDERMTRITIDMLQNIDAVIVPIHARSPFSETEKKFVCQLINCNNINNIIFVVTYMDQLDEDDYKYETFIEFIKTRIRKEVFLEIGKPGAKEDLITKAHVLLDHMNICGISSSLALVSFVSNNSELLKLSRFEEFHTLLLQVVTAKQLENAADKTIRIIKYVLSQFDIQNKKRLDYFNSRINKDETDKKTILQYTDGLLKYYENTFATDFIEIKKAINQLNAYKNIIVKMFIKNLSAIRTSTHECVLNALQLSLTQAIQLISEKQINGEVIRICEATIIKLNKFSKDELGLAYESINKKVNFTDIKYDMQRIVSNILGNIKFSWSVSPIPNSYDLSKCNVIETVINATDKSITKYVNEMIEAIYSLRNAWYNLSLLQTNEIRDYVIKNIDPELENCDMHYKAHIRNYQVMSENSKKILSQSEAIRRELLHNY